MEKVYMHELYLLTQLKLIVENLLLLSSIYCMHFDFWLRDHLIVLHIDSYELTFELQVKCFR